MYISATSEGFFHERDEARFYECLNQTMAWCAENGTLKDPEGSLRRLRPDARWSDLCARSSRVGCIASLRADRLRATGYTKRTEPPSSLFGGKLFAYFPDGNMYDGAAQAETGGWFDADNIPPSDTWICMVDEMLISWVPASFVELVQGGIDVNPEECICWLEQVDWPIVHKLRERRLV